DTHVIQADISAERPPLPDGMTFDVISACEVFLHVLEPDGLDRALGHLARLCSPGGLLLISDPILSDAGYSPAQAPVNYFTMRRASEYRSALARHGFAVQAIRPATIVLNNPLEAPNRVMYKLFRIWWRLCRISARWWLRSAALTKVVGGALLWLDQV